MRLGSSPMPASQYEGLGGVVEVEGPDESG